MAYTGVSIVDYLKSIGEDSSYAARAKRAGQMGIQNYTGTAAQNTQMLNSLRNPVQKTQPVTQIAQPVTQATNPVAQTAQGTNPGATVDPVKEKILAGNAPQTYGQMPGTYQSRFDEDTMALVDKILNYKPFSYDHASDPSYQAYEKQYTKLGETAFQDTIGDLTSMTGGRLNSWATSAASQAKSSYMQDLSNIIPTLEQNAYGRYQNEHDMLRDNLNTLMDVENVDYGRYRDLVGDYADNRNYERGVLESDRSFDRNVLESDRVYDYQVTRDNVLDDRWLKQFDYEKQQDIINNAMQSRQISVSEANAALNRAEFNYKKTQDAKNEKNTTAPTAGQLDKYNQIVAGLSKNPSGALSYMDKLGKDFYTDLIGENLYNQLVSDMQSGNTPKKTDLSLYYKKIDDMLDTTIESYNEDAAEVMKVPRYEDDQIINYIMNLGLDPGATAELLNYAGVSK